MIQRQGDVILPACYYIRRLPRVPCKYCKKKRKIARSFFNAKPVRRSCGMHVIVTNF